MHSTAPFLSIQAKPYVSAASAPPPRSVLAKKNSKVFEVQAQAHGMSVGAEVFMID
ncbi:MAG: hypothetical protein IPO43_13635 [Rhodoferax sp.]|nr:hypothetical protein [Rhodoferax sp.]